MPSLYEHYKKKHLNAPRKSEVLMEATKLALSLNVIAAVGSDEECDMALKLKQPLAQFIDEASGHTYRG